MPLTLTEKLDSRRWTTGENASVEMTFTLRGTSSDTEALVTLQNSTATSYNGLVRQSIQIEPEWVDESAADGLWNATVRYGLRPPPELEEWTFSFDTTGGTQHITQSIATVARYAPPGKTAPDFGGAIGVTHDSVEGVDITVPVFNFTLRRRIPVEQWTAAYVTGLYALTGKVNSTGFWISIRGDRYQFAAGEVLFLGASADESTASDFVDITYRFAASPNRTGITVGEITGIAKWGWEYLWVRYADAEDATAKAIVKKPVAAYVEKVYEVGDFSVIGSI